MLSLLLSVLLGGTQPQVDGPPVMESPIPASYVKVVQISCVGNKTGAPNAIVRFQMTSNGPGEASSSVLSTTIGGKEVPKATLNRLNALASGGIVANASAGCTSKMISISFEVFRPEKGEFAECLLDANQYLSIEANLDGSDVELH